MNVVRPLVAITLSLGLAGAAAAQPTKPAPKPHPSAPLSATAAAQAPAAPAPTNVCDYIELQDATTMLGAEASASTAPSRGALLSCGYTSPSGNSVKVSIADYGIPSIAQQFFEKTWELTKTATVEDSLGTSGFAVIAAEPPPARASITVLKAEKIVTIEAAGPNVGKAESLPAMRAIIVKLLPKLQPAPAPQP
jgi:hypothetical protein